MGDRVEALLEEVIQELLGERESLSQEPRSVRVGAMGRGLSVTITAAEKLLAWRIYYRTRIKG